MDVAVNVAELGAETAFIAKDFLVNQGAETVQLHQ
jgi:hypothetical protein